MSAPSSSVPTVEDILRLQKPTEEFLCPLSANIYNIQFKIFEIRDLEHNSLIFRIAADTGITGSGTIVAPESFDEDSVRTIRYLFDPSMLDLELVGTSLTFSVGDKPVSNFRMIERHYFRDRLIKSFDFSFPFCIPNSTNSWDCEYELPDLTRAEKRDILDNPFLTRSDSFYFVDNKLIMHNRAMYAYSKDL